MQHFVHPDGCDTIGMCLDSGQTMGILWESYEKTCWEIHGKPMGNYGKLYSLWILCLLGINYRISKGAFFGCGVFPHPFQKWAPGGLDCITGLPLVAVHVKHNDLGEWRSMAKHGEASGPY